eukprot:12688066-Ditylum_brightwellii.AAC.1
MHSRRCAVPKDDDGSGSQTRSDKTRNVCPARLSQNGGEKEYKDKLRAHNAYINAVMSVKVFGLSKDAMYSNVTIDSENSFLEDYLNNEIPFIDKIKETKKTNAEGCWLI